MSHSNLPSENTKRCKNLTEFVGGKEAGSYKSWILIDATNMVVGRLAVVISNLLSGKSTAHYTPHTDAGSNVVVINVDKVILSGRKEISKNYYSHTGWPGGLKTSNAKTVRSGKKPWFILFNAVKGMMPRCKMSRKRIKNLYLYSGSEHKQIAQAPVLLDVASMNRKNRKD